ncbi:protein-disulfide reductase DsbD N-terminal domain-containing protein, partial [Castellaniella defragrans]
MSYLPGSSIPRPVCRPAAPGVNRSARTAPRPASPPFVRGLPRRMAALLGILLLALCGLLLGSGPARAADDFLPPEQAFADTAAMADPLTLDVHWEIAPGYYMYQDRFEVRIEDAQGRLLVFRRSDLTPEDAETRAPAWGDALRLPHGRVKYDPTFEKDMEVFHGGVTLRTALRPGAGGPLRVSVTGQGCADEGLCYPPMTKTLVLQADGGGYRAVGEQVRDRVPPPRDETPAAAAPGGAPGTDTGLSAALRGGAGAAP